MLLICREYPSGEVKYYTYKLIYAIKLPLCYIMEIICILITGSQFCMIKLMCSSVFLDYIILLIHVEYRDTHSHKLQIFR